MDRRDYLKSVAAGIAGVVAGNSQDTESEPDPHPEPEADIEDLYERREIGAEVVGDATPIVIDPEILGIVELEAPFVPGEAPVPDRAEMIQMDHVTFMEDR